MSVYAGGGDGGGDEAGWSGGDCPMTIWASAGTACEKIVGERAKRKIVRASPIIWFQVAGCGLRNGSDQIDGMEELQVKGKGEGWKP